MSTQSTSVTPADALFYHNPPTNERFLKDVFVGRSRELVRMRKRVPGTTSACIQAIHGESRVGKSHLTLRFLQELDRQHVFTVPAGEGKKARLVLQDLYESVRRRITEIQEPAELVPEGVGSTGLLEEARGMIRMMDQLLLDGEASRKITVAQTFKATAAFQILAKLFGLSAGLSGSDEETIGKTSEVLVPAPSDHRIVDFIRELCEVLHHTTGKDSVVYVDDIDLLDLGSSDDQEQVALLMRLLHRLSESPHIAVLASLRTRHMTIGQKALQELIKVEPLNEGDVRTVYQQHVDHFNGGRAVFEKDCLNELVAAAGKQIGTFLRTCSRFHAWAEVRGLVDDERKLTLADLEAFYLHEISVLRRNQNHRLTIQRIYDAAQSHKQDVELEPAVARSELVYILLEEPVGPGEHIWYTINPIVARVMAAGKASG